MSASSPSDLGIIFMKTGGRIALNRPCLEVARHTGY